MPQVRIDLDDDLFAVLERYAEEECRLPTGQATWLIRLALRERLKFDAALRHLESRGPGPSLRGDLPLLVSRCCLCLLRPTRSRFRSVQDVEPSTLS